MTDQRWQRLFVGALIAYALLQVFNFFWVGSSFGFGQLLPAGDSVVYESVASSPWWSRDLWAGVLPFGYPVILKLTGTGALLFALQTLGSAMAWLGLAWEVNAVARRRSVGAVSAIGVLLMSLAPEVSTPHQLILTESLSLTLMVVLVALCLRWLRTNSKATQALLLPVSLLWIELRPTSMVVVAGSAVVALVWAARAKRSDIAVLAMGGLAMSAAFVALGAEQGGQTTLRWVVEVGLTDPDARSFLIDRGMPVNETVLSLAERNSQVSDFKNRVGADPRLDEFREWVAQDSAKAYAAWLLADPADLTVTLGRSFSASFAEDADEMFLKGRRAGMALTLSAQEARLPVGGTLGGVVWVGPHGPLAAVVGYTMVAAVVVLRLKPRGIADPRWKLGWLLMFLVPVHVAISYFGDTVEQLRHGLGAALQLRLAVVLLVAWCFDSLLAGQRRSAPPTQRDTSASTRSKVTA